MTEEQTKKIVLMTLLVLLRDKGVIEESEVDNITTVTNLIDKLVSHNVISEEELASESSSLVELINFVVDKFDNGQIRSRQAQRDILEKAKGRFPNLLKHLTEEKVDEPKSRS